MQQQREAHGAGPEYLECIPPEQQDQEVERFGASAVDDRDADRDRVEEAAAEHQHSRVTPLEPSAGGEDHVDAQVGGCVEEDAVASCAKALGWRSLVDFFPRHRATELRRGSTYEPSAPGSRPEGPAPPATRTRI